MSFEMADNHMVFFAEIAFIYGGNDSSKVIATDDGAFRAQRIFTFALIGIIILGIKYFAGNTKLVQQFCFPLFAQGRRADNQDFALAYGPILTDDKTCLNGLSKSHLTSGNIKNVEPVLLPVPRSKGSRIAQSVETSNAESPTQNVIAILIRHTKLAVTPTCTTWAVYKHPKGRPRCLVFNEQFEFARFSSRQNQGVRKRLCP